MTKSLTQDQAAALRGVTARRLRQMAGEDNPPPQDENGQYRPEEFGAWLRAGDKAADYYAERARLTKEQADEKEMANARQRGLLVYASVIADLWAKVAMAAKTRLLAIPSKCAPLLVGRTAAEIKDILETHVHECASAIAGDPMGESLDAAAEVDSKPVGGQEPKTKPRGKRGAGRVGH